jgi:leucyl/phenylalanyl-tRNA--protein transferase
MVESQLCRFAKLSEEGLAGWAPAARLGKCSLGMRIAVLDHQLRFPHPREATADGLVAIGGDLSVERLALAYRSGIFPWTIDPITWWSPDPRAIFEFEQFHVSRSLDRTIRKGGFEITLDRAFRRVMEGCAASARGRRTTWISPEFIEAYSRLHESGNAHSVECWHGPALVGGVYGVAIGGFFAGESMFHRVTDASKVALFHLNRHLQERGFALFDVQMVTPVTAQLGARMISRAEYLVRLEKATQMPCRFCG